MADRKTNLLITMVFDENLHIGKQVDTELSFKQEITKDLQHLMIGREIKHFVIADDEVINEKLTQERKVGKWIGEKGYPICDKCGCDVIGEYISKTEYAEMYKPMKFCPNCGAEMRGNENE